MMGEWREVILQDVTTRIGDDLHGTPKYNPNGEYYFINGNNLKDGKILLKPDTKKVMKDEAIKYQKPLSNKTILLSINGTIGNLAFYNYEKCMLGKSACYINVSDEIDVRFLYYHCLDEEFQFYIEMVATGTTIPNVPLKGIRQYSFDLPPLKEQQAIAEVLSSLDDKIDLLHRQNKTLEKLAQTLFRQWFVEEVGDDWEEGTIGDITVLKSGKSRPKEDTEINLIPIYGGNGVLGYVNQYNAEDESIIIGRVGAYCGSLYLENKPIWVSDNALLAKAKDNIFSKFLFYTLKINELNSMAEGSSHPLLTQGLIKSIAITIPPREKLTKFNVQVNTWYKKINFNTTQIKTLENMRDTLLPKLMSGEVRVKNG